MQVNPLSSAADQTLNTQYNNMGNTGQTLTPDQFAFANTNSSTVKDLSPSDKLTELKLRNNIAPNIQTLDQFNKANATSLVPIAGYLQNQANSPSHYNPNSISDSTQLQPVANNLLTETAPQYNSPLDFQNGQFNLGNQETQPQSPFAYNQALLPEGFIPNGTADFGRIINNPAGKLDPTSFADLGKTVNQNTNPANISNNIVPASGLARRPDQSTKPEIKNNIISTENKLKTNTGKILPAETIDDVIKVATSDLNKAQKKLDQIRRERALNKI